MDVEAPGRDLCVTVRQPFDEVVAAVRTALGEEGFGVLTEIDVAATMQAKLGAEMEPYLILGACNPHLAFRALGVDPSLGLLLPCNVVVRRTSVGTVVEAVDPKMLVDLTGDAGLSSVADEAAGKLRSALARLTADAAARPSA